MVTIRFSTEGNAMRDHEHHDLSIPAVAEALRDVIDQIENGGVLSGVVTDYNDHTIGTFDVDED